MSFLKPSYLDKVKKMRTDLNQLEPQSLVDAFLKYPPETFRIQNSADFLPFFTTKFNLLTTLDVADRKKIESFFAYSYWGKLLNLSTCFIGTTVSEYTPLSSDISAIEMSLKLKQIAQNHTLTIIKDLPINSPLLSKRENDFSQELISTAEKYGFISVEGQALAYVPIDFKDQEDYLSRLSKSRRKNLKRKLKSLENLNIEILKTGDQKFLNPEFRQQLYQLYLAVYEQSDIHFDLLTPQFFDEILLNASNGGRVFFYWDQELLVGFNICFEYQNNLIDKYIGLNYPLALEHNLYFVSWFINLNFAKQQGLNFYIAGWTDPEVKSQLGAKFTFTRHLVWIRQPILRFVLGKLKHLFESDSHWHEKMQELKHE